ncbi:Hypothetical protein R9X50_00797900 [Acrodontium crateriforme]|uniref:Uncharacterized protein n=1 Tax=Acrodontium crateriforme TaxID=150365 RepID=A0AAQ3MC41_9PEZI|nr:Hypothetical protein R9X50_00797900 [Acrodontium crateriforme]
MIQPYRPSTWEQIHYTQFHNTPILEKKLKAVKPAGEKKESHKLASALKALLKGNYTKSAQSSGANTPQTGAATPARSPSGSSTRANSRTGSRASSVHRMSVANFGAVSHLSLK